MLLARLRYARAELLINIGEVTTTAWSRRYVLLLNARSYNQCRKSGSPKGRRRTDVVIGSRIQIAIRHLHVRQRDGQTLPASSPSTPKPLDYEMQRSYHLNITASGQGSSSLLSSIASLANDNALALP